MGESKLNRTQGEEALKSCAGVQLSCSILKSVRIRR